MPQFPVETIATRPPVVMFTAPNPGPKTLEGTHSFAVGRKQAHIVDPGPRIPEYQAFLARWVQENGRQVRAILLTHDHPDHAPGAVTLRSSLRVPVWCSRHVSASQAQTLGADRRFAGGEIFPVDGDLLRVVATPGHSRDHVAFWLERAGILFSGDTILGQGSTLIAPPEGNMIAYMQSLQIIRDLRPRLIAPGHGPLVANPDAKIEEYVRHRREREKQLLRALAGGPATVRALVSRVYVDLPPEMHDLARASLEAQLAKLLTEHRVRRAGDNFVLNEAG